MNRKKVKQSIKKYIEEHGEPECAYFYDDCSLVLEYIDSKTGLGILGDETFEYWEDDVLIEDYILQENYEKLLEEIGVNCAVLPLEYRSSEESLDSIEDELVEYCLENPELMDKLHKMSKTEEVNFYRELSQKRNNGFALEYASRELQNDKEVVLKAVKQNGLALKRASRELQNDKEVVLEAVKQNGFALKYASRELQNDKEFILEAVKQNGLALKCASRELQNDKEVVLEAVKQNGAALDYASCELQNDKEVVLEAVKQKGDALRCASAELRNDKEVVLEAIKRNRNALVYAGSKLQRDKDILKARNKS